MLSESRYLSLKHWLATVLSPKDDCSSLQLSSMAGDAGFRQYYRFHHDGVSFIAVDAPPSLSNNDAFVALQQSLASQNICVPQIIACDLTQGFFCLSDFGDYLLADLVKSEKESALVKSFYMKAINMLPSIAKARILPTNDYKLPIYDRAFIQLELSIFTDWLLSKHLNIKLLLYYQYHALKLIVLKKYLISVLTLIWLFGLFSFIRFFWGKLRFCSWMKFFVGLSKMAISEVRIYLCC